MISQSWHDKRGVTSILKQRLVLFFKIKFYYKDSINNSNKKIKSESKNHQFVSLCMGAIVKCNTLCAVGVLLFSSLPYILHRGCYMSILYFFLEKGTDESFGIFILIKKSENNNKMPKPTRREKCWHLA